MFETIEGILSVAAGGLALIGALAGLVVSLAKCLKNKKLAAAAQKVNDVASLIAGKVVEAETLFASSGDGARKKESVMSFIEEQCEENALAFDPDYWSERVEQLVNVLNAAKKGTEESV